MTDTSSPKPKLTAQTLTAQALGHIDARTREIIPALHLSTTYERDIDGGYSSGRGYTRPHNPSYDEPELLLQTLEGGSDCLLFASGMAAATAVFQSLLPGDHVVAPRIMYWALRKWLVETAMNWGLEVEFVDTCQPQAIAAAMRPGQTRLLWLETPSNPTWDITDIAQAAVIAHQANARLAVDSTVSSPVLTRPIEHGADLVVHSATKYLNGHSDVLAGAVVCAREDAFWQRIRAWRRDAGAVPGPFEAWLLLRGMRTLFVRMQRCCENAMAIARHFESHPLIHRVLYPGLESHPGHAIASRQMTGGYSGMLSLRLLGGEAAAMATAANVRIFKRATSLGGVESLIEHRASIEGPATPVPMDLLRLSIGIEDPADLIADLEQALALAQSQHPIAHSTQADVQNSTDTESDPLQMLIDSQLRPLALERGGDLQFDSCEEGIVRILASGSPGALRPLHGHIQNLLRHYIDPQLSLELLGSRSGPAAATLAVEASLKDRIKQVLTEHINPALASHGGHVSLTAVENNLARLRLEQRCQGCALAEVTLRQGIEVVLLEHIPELAGVVDVTEHHLGTDPYFITHKGSPSKHS